MNNKEIVLKNINEIIGDSEDNNDYILDHFYIDYYDVIRTLLKSNIKIEISLQSKEDANYLDGKQLTKNTFQKIYIKN